MFRVGWDRTPDASVVGGGIGWAALAYGGVLGPIGEVLSLALLVHVPLGLSLADAPTATGRGRNGTN